MTEDTGRKSKANSGDVTVLVEADQSDDRVVCVDHLLTERPLLQALLSGVIWNWLCFDLPAAT